MSTLMKDIGFTGGEIKNGVKIISKVAEKGSRVLRFRDINMNIIYRLFFQKMMNRSLRGQTRYIHIHCQVTSETTFQQPL